jgi:hypothetical protein
MTSPALALRSREIRVADLPSVATLLARGFPRRSRSFWLRALEQLTAREPPQDLPKYGYLLESDDVPVGVILFICSAIREGEKTVIRCNQSSWYVEPYFRAYAPLLLLKASRDKDVTYSNLSPMPHTWPIIEAQGFTRYCDGVFVAVPVLSHSSGGEQVKVFDAHCKPEVAFDPHQQELMLEHARYGCISLWCATADRAYPFIFRPRLVRGIVPCVQMIYCPEIAEFVRFAGPIGRFLAVRGRPLVIIDANGPVAGLVGAYFRDRPRRYFKGPQRPRLGDLTYTELALWGG